MVLGAAALAVVTTAAAVWFGISWISAANDDDLALDRTRDEVSRVAEAAVVTLNTLDYRDPDKSLDQWEAAVTGDLYNDIHNGRKGADAKIAEGRTSTSAKVLKLAVTSLNDHEGTAQVMTAVSWTKAVDGKAPESEYRRYQASLLRTDTGWKVNGIAQVPYNPGT
ncbi:hypothetical protein BJP25_29005 [Actinokineospora bangkokensis]|uniref:Mce-associated membrane protein n=1 Tax=Actinokineospora bangkokensis TaxID=1193682 RepID=A0A1Q9LGH5_9PSEU|nr:hypothetical protein BJP25_29005 [Actinokineospora bangkokensis]